MIFNKVQFSENTYVYLKYGGQKFSTGQRFIFTEVFNFLQNPYFIDMCFFTQFIDVFICIFEF